MCSPRRTLGFFSTIQYMSVVVRDKFCSATMSFWPTRIPLRHFPISQSFRSERFFHPMAMPMLGHIYRFFSLMILTRTDFSRFTCYNNVILSEICPEYSYISSWPLLWPRKQLIDTPTLCRSSDLNFQNEIRIVVLHTH